MDLSALFAALLMGVVEGLTEFLPISSTGHLILLGEVIGFQGPPGRVFEISIQLGAILAVVVVFWRDLIRILLGMWKPRTPERYVAEGVVLAFLPAAVIGATLHGTITRLLFSPLVVAVALVIGGLIIIWIERRHREPTIRSVAEIGPTSALMIGFGQALAMIPGTSRSGATIIVALLIGVERRAAAEFSFLLAIPTMLAATAFSLFKARNEIDVSGFGQILVGFAAAFVVALLIVRWLLSAISRIGFTPFGWYRVVLGGVILVALLV
ncbi:undecaprenyl-diphosphate phosphatase [Roseomonas sp. CCTCC AB2023176]|uniref:undecaprenyl-diphosphate phosphatase n=1 Tax=Roseomonas sp. CCTCC AB2023176 TaxID=3342640 RepID=UPI0035DF1DA9